MAFADLPSRYGARLLIEWLHQRFEAKLDITDDSGDAFVASDGEHRVGVYIAPLWETTDAWEERLRALAERLNATGVEGSHILWVPPRADLPAEEPALSDFALRVQMAATGLRSG